MWEPLIITACFAAISTLISIVLYKRSESHIQYKWARFSGAAAIAVAAYLGMTSFYLDLFDTVNIRESRMLDRFRVVRTAYDHCVEQEPAFQCRDPATDVRDTCSEILEIDTSPL